MNTQNESEQKRILIIDDEPAICELLSRRLQSWGYEVRVASDGKAGWQMAQTENPDLILLDILMPGEDGRELCARLKTHPKLSAIPVIFLTALKMPEHIELSFNVHPDDYLIKPFEAQELKNRVQLCLQRSGLRS